MPLAYINPGMNGVETLAALRKFDQVVPVILSSGYGKKEALAQQGAAGWATSLARPYSPEALRQKI